MDGHVDRISYLPPPPLHSWWREWLTPKPLCLGLWSDLVLSVCLVFLLLPWFHSSTTNSHPPPSTQCSPFPCSPVHCAFSGFSRIVFTFMKRFESPYIYTFGLSGENTVRRNRWRKPSPIMTKTRSLLGEGLSSGTFYWPAKDIK